MKTLLSLLAFVSFALPAHAARSLPITYSENGKSFKGDLFLPNHATEALPLVVVVHEWWGKTEHPVSRARRIADELGYAALAVDLYGDGKTVSTPAEATKMSEPFYKDRTLGAKRIQGFITTALANAKLVSAEKGTSAIDASKIVSIGFCFGGTQSLDLARAGALPGAAKLVGVVSFHGGLGSGGHDAKGPIEPKILVLHGEADPFVPAKEVEAFKKEMKEAGADMTFVGYPGATHAFTNPKATAIGKKFKIPIAYHKAADLASWRELKQFLSARF